MTDKDFALTHLFKKIVDTGDYNLELYITSECNLKCKYCYLRRNEELYPHELRNHETILENLDILFDKLLKNNLVNFANIDVFSGEIWGTSFGREVLQKIIKFARESKINSIVIPSNMTFLLDENNKTYYESVIEDLRKNNVYIFFSQSFDGILEEDNRRASTSIQRNEKYLQSLKDWYQKYNFCFHPMVSAIGIEKWSDNFTFFKEFLECDTYSEMLKDVMCLEVRDNNWTEEKLIKYVEVQKFLFEKVYEENKDDLIHFLKIIFKHNFSQTSPISIQTNFNRITCSIQQTVAIRLGDLAWVPCHRTSYPHFIYGYIDKGGEELSLIENNLQMSTTVYGLNPDYCMPVCEYCTLSPYCMKQCLGSQYEIHGDPFESNTLVCDLYKTKLVTLYELFTHYNIFEQTAALVNDEHNFKEIVFDFKFTIEKFLKEENNNDSE